MPMPMPGGSAIALPELCLDKLKWDFVVVVALLFYVHGKHLKSCWDIHTFPGQA